MFLLFLPPVNSPQVTSYIFGLNKGKASKIGTLGSLTLDSLAPGSWEYIAAGARESNSGVARSRVDPTAKEAHPADADTFPEAGHR